MTKPHLRPANASAAAELDEAGLDGAVGGTGETLVGIDFRPAGVGGIYVASGDVNGDGSVKSISYDISKPRT